MSITQSEFDDLSARGYVAVLSKSITLTDAQIKLLPSTYYEIVAAPGSGKAIIPIACFVQIDASGGAYGLVGHEATLNLIWGTSGSNYVSGILSTHFVISTGLKGAGQMLIPYPFNVGSGDLSGEIKSELTDFPAENRPLTIKDDWDGTSNYTGGNAANSAKVTLIYTIVNV